MKKPVAYVETYDNEKKNPTPLYTFYEKGIKATEALDLRAALIRYPINQYEWFKR